MQARTRFDVVPDAREGGWLVNNGSSSDHHATKLMAVIAAAKAAKNHGNAQVVIRRKNGQIQSERTYGNDPRRSKR